MLTLINIELHDFFPVMEQLKEYPYEEEFGEDR